MKDIINLIFFLTAFCLIIHLIYQIQLQASGRSPGRKTETPDPVVRDLQLRASAMLAGDKDALKRLVSLTQSRFPGKSDRWIYGKLIEDLMRDRR